MTQTIQQSTTQDAVATYLEGLRSLDAERALSRFSPDAVVHYPGQPPMSPDAFRASLSQVFSALKSMEFTTREVFETDHGVGARWTFTAETHAGNMASCDGIDSWRIGADGSITAIDVYYDPSPLMEALAQ
jgi:ketosteroid isomerase-like protein